MSPMISSFGKVFLLDNTAFKKLNICSLDYDEAEVAIIIREIRESHGQKQTLSTQWCTVFGSNWRACCISVRSKGGTARTHLCWYPSRREKIWRQIKRIYYSASYMASLCQSVQIYFRASVPASTIHLLCSCTFQYSYRCMRRSVSIMMFSTILSGQTS